MNKIVCLAVTTLLLGVVDNASASLVAHWGFNETDGLTAVDTIGGVNGTLVGGAAFATTSGILGGAVQISDGYVDMGNNFPITTNGFSIQAWVKTTPGDSTFIYPVAKHLAGISQGYFLGLNWPLTGITEFYTAPNQIEGPSANNGLWHQLVGVFNNGTENLYFDGNLAASGVWEYSGNNDAHLTIGEVLDPSGVPVSRLDKVMIDEVKIWNNALSSAEVNSIYLNTVPVPGAVWLFGSALLGLLVVNKRNSLSVRH